MKIKRITPCIWFDNQAEEAAKFYTSIFKNSKIGTITHYDKASAEVSGRPEGSVLTVSFTLDGQDFVGLNGGPIFKLTEAVSFIINCETQDEVDYYWEKLTAGGEEVQCGWLKDKFGLSWQVTPEILNKLIADKDPKVSSHAMKSMLKMKKIVIKELTA